MDTRHRLKYFLVPNMETKEVGDELSPLNDVVVKDLLKVCGQYDRGLVTAEEACQKILCGCVEPHLVSEYIDLLPQSLRLAFPAVLSSLPVSDEDWLGPMAMPFAQFDGTVDSWTRSVMKYRANAEAVRECMLDETSVPAAPDFEERVRAARRASLAVSI